MKKVSLVICLLAIVGCSSSETQVKEAIKKNPNIVFDVIEENPEQFIEVVNRAAQKAQAKQYEKQVAERKSAQEGDLKNPKHPALVSDRKLSGDDTGKIIVVEYADFQCPACSMAYDSLKQLKEKYKGQVQFYYKHMPLDFHKMAYPSALYFEAVRLQDKSKAKKFYEYLFENQRQLVDEDFLKQAAAHVGANMKKIEVDIKSEAVSKIIEEDMAEFQKFGFTGTPVLIVNGVALNGAQRIEELDRVVSLTLAK